MNDNLEEKIKELRNGYISKLKDTFLDFRALLNDNQINIQEIYSKIHTIAGTSGMYGLKDLSDISTEFEIYLKPLKENQNSINTEELKIKFSNYLDCISDIIVGE